MRPTTSSPTSEPTSRPSKSPSTSSPTLDGDTNPPTSSPTFGPTLLLNDYETQQSYIEYLQTVEDYDSIENSFSFNTFYYKGLTIEGSCVEWTDFYDGTLALPFDDVVFDKLSSYYVVDNFETGESYQTTASCKDKNIIKGIVSSLRTGTDYEGNCEFNTWRVFECNDRSVLCVNCKKKCVDTEACPGRANIFNTCGTTCDYRLAAGSAINFQYSLVELHPRLHLPFNITASRTSIQVSVNMTKAGTLFCAAFSADSPVSSLFQIRDNGESAFITRTGNVSLELTGLNPETEYEVYCYTEDFASHIMPVETALQTRTLVNTKCCRFVVAESFVSSIVQYFPGSSNTEFVFKLGLDSQPTDIAVLDIKLYVTTCPQTGSRATTLPVATPSQFSFDSTSTSLSAPFIVRGVESGCFLLSARVIGVDSFVSFNRSLEIRNVRAPPNSPLAVSAVISNDGASFILTFDSDTDRGFSVITAFESSFACSQILIFPGNSISLCKWTLPNQLTVTFGTADVLPEIGDVITLRANVIRASCSDTTTCSIYEFSPAANVTLKGPVNGLKPIVILSASPSVGSCHDITLDPTGSSGNAGRDWFELFWTVQGTATFSNNSRIADWLNSEYVDTDGIASVPNSFLDRGKSYTFRLTLTNYLLLSRIAEVTVTVDTSDFVTPLVRVYGSSLVLYAWKSVSLFAVASFPLCSGDTSDLTLTYSWKVYRGITFITSIVSTSRNPRHFKLNPYTLESNTEYTIEARVSATSGTSTLTGTASYPLLIGQAGVEVVISGSSQRTVFLSDSFSLDASASSDLDNPSTSVLQYQWDCVEISPSFGASCGVALPTTAVISLAGSALGVGQYNFTATVTNSLSFQNQDSVLVRVSQGIAPSVAINRPVTKYNPKNKLILTGNVVNTGQSSTAQWSSSSVSTLSDINLSPLTKTLKEGAKIFQLSIAADSLTAGLSYTFTLQAAYSSTSSVSNSASVTVVVNAPPLGGVLSVAPRTGTALTTVFRLLTTRWYDDPEDYPITYAFSYYRRDSAAQYVLKNDDEVPYADTYIGQGLASQGNRVTVVVTAADVLESSGSASLTANVRSASVNAETVAATTSAITRAIQDRDPAGLSQLVNAAANSVKAKSCNVAVQCSIRNREGCEDTADTCGPCLSGYVGVEGDSNIPCQQPSVSRAVGASCSTSSVCMSGFCEDGVCADVNKPCPDDCGGRGTCEFVNSAGELLESCSVFNSFCFAECRCDSGRFGDDCSLLGTDLTVRIGLIEELCYGLYETLDIQDVTFEVLVTRALTVYDLLSDMAQVSDNAYSLCTEVLMRTVQQEPELSCTGSAPTYVANAVSNIVKRNDISVAILQNVTTVLTDLTLTCQEDLSIGESAFSRVNQNLRILTIVTTPDDLVDEGTVEVAQTESERLNGRSSSRVIVDTNDVPSGGTVGITLVQYNNNPFKIKSNSTSVNIQTVQYSSTPGEEDLNNRRRLATTALPLGVTVVLTNTEPVTYNSIEPAEVSVQCSRRDSAAYTVNATCPSGYTFDLVCPPGSRGVFNVTCPGYSTAPQCTTEEDTVLVPAESCTLLNFTEESTTCACLAEEAAVSSSLMFSRRLQVTDVQPYTKQYGSSLVVSNFFFDSSFIAFPNLEEPENHYILISTLFSIFGVLLIGFFYCLFVLLSKKRAEGKVAVEANSLPASRTIQGFFESAYPSVFSSVREKRTWQTVVSQCLWEGHSLLRLWTKKSEKDQQTLVVRWLSAAGILSTLFFFNSVLAFVVYPYESSCADLQTEETCLDKEGFTNMHEVCRWSERHRACTYRSPGISVFDVLVYGNFVVLLSVVYKHLLDYVVVNAVNELFRFFKARKTTATSLIIARYAPESDKVQGLRRMPSCLKDSMKFSSDYLDEFESIPTVGHTLMLAARLAKVNETIESSTPVGELQLIASSLQKRRTEKADRHFKEALMNFDLPRSVSRYEKLCETLDDNKIFRDLKLSIEKTKVLTRQLQLTWSDEDKEKMLLTWFIADCLPSNLHSVVDRKVLNRQGREPSHSGSHRSFASYLISVCFILLCLAHFALVIYAAIVFNKYIVSLNAGLWAVCFAVAFTEYYGLVEVLVILLQDVVVVQMLVRRKLRDQWMIVTRHAKLVLMRTTGLMKDAHALVQHFNPACRAARTFPHLPVARMLISMSDLDITRAVLPEENISSVLYKAFIKVLLVPFEFLPYELATATYDVVVVLAVGGIMILWYFFGVWNYIAATTVACAVALLPLVILGVKAYQDNKIRRLEIHAKEAEFEDMFYEGGVEDEDEAPMSPIDLRVYTHSKSFRSNRILDGSTIVAEPTRLSLDLDALDEDGGVGPMHELALDSPVLDFAGIYDKTTPHIIGMDKKPDDEFNYALDVASLKPTIGGIRSSKEPEFSTRRRLLTGAILLPPLNRNIVVTPAAKPEVQPISAEEPPVVFHSNRDRRRIYKGLMEKPSKPSGPGAHSADAKIEEEVMSGIHSIGSNNRLDLSPAGDPMSSTMLIQTDETELPVLDLFGRFDEYGSASLSPGSPIQPNETPSTPMNQRDLHSQQGNRHGRRSHGARSPVRPGPLAEERVPGGYRPSDETKSSKHAN